MACWGWACWQTIPNSVLLLTCQAMTHWMLGKKTCCWHGSIIPFFAVWADRLLPCFPTQLHQGCLTSDVIILQTAISGATTFFLMFVSLRRVHDRVHIYHLCVIFYFPWLGTRWMGPISITFRVSSESYIFPVCVSFTLPSCTQLLWNQGFKPSHKVPTVCYLQEVKGTAVKVLGVKLTWPSSLLLVH